MEYTEQILDPTVDQLIQNMNEIQPDTLTQEEMFILRASTIYSILTPNNSTEAYPYQKVFSDNNKESFVLQLNEGKHIFVNRLLTEEMKRFAKYRLCKETKHRALPFYSQSNEFITNIGYITITDCNDNISDIFFTFREIF